MKVGDLVIWKQDGDIGVVTEALSGSLEIYIEWASEPHKSGLHNKHHPQLEKLS